MIIDISTGEYKVLETDTIYLFEPYSDLKLHFETAYAEFVFDVKLLFITDKENKMQKVKKEVNGNEIVFEFTNFDNPFGSGTTKPIELATINDKKIYIHIWIYAVAKEENNVITRKVEYTVFMER